MYEILLLCSYLLKKKKILPIFIIFIIFYDMLIILSLYRLVCEGND